MRGRLVLIAFVVGAASVHHLARLPEPWLWAQLALACGVLCSISWKIRCRTPWAVVLMVIAGLVAGFTYAGWRAQWRLDDGLACRHRDQVTRLTLRVISLPTGGEQVRTFDAQVLDNGAYCAMSDGGCTTMPPLLPGIPGTVRVSWRTPPGSQAKLAAVLPGQIWRMALRLRAPHASLNPHAADGEGRLFAQGVRAVGSVRGTPALLADDPWASGRTAVARTRYALRAVMLDVLGTKRYAPILIALALGDQSALPRADWTMLSRAGLSHLVAISGLHVGIVAGLAAGACGFVYRRLRIRRRMLAQVVPAQIIMAVTAWAAAALYCSLAGWGIPARRVFFMLSVVALAVSCRVPVSVSRTLSLAAGLVVVVDPWAPLSIGFWLSFVAVAALMMMVSSAPALAPTPAPAPVLEAALTPGSRPGRAALRTPRAQVASFTDHARALWHQSRLFSWGRSSPDLRCLPSPDDLLHVEEVPLTRSENLRAMLGALRTAAVRACRGAARIQSLLTLALAPLLALTVGQVSVVSPFVNAFAIPIVGMLVTPLALACAALSGAAGLGVPGAETVARWTGAGAHAMLAPTLEAARMFSAPDWAVWWVAKAPWPFAALALGCAAWALLPVGAPCRRLAWAGVIPLLLWKPAPMPTGAWDLVALDVGQAGAAVINTRHHVVVFDTGLRYESGDDAGSRVLVPFLRAIGRSRVDRLIVSHAHLDHMGGVRGLMNGMPVVRSHAPFDLNRHLQREAAMLHDGVPAKGWPLSVTRCEVGQTWTFDGVDFSFLHPQPGQRYSQSQANASSCVLRVRGSHHSAVLPGDIGAAEETSIIHTQTASELEAGVDVALVAHHGSLTSSSPVWIDSLQARHVIAQAGHNSPFGHPAARVQQRWIERGASFWRNDLDGAVWVESREKGLMVHAWRDSAMRYWHEPLTGHALDQCATSSDIVRDGLR